MTFPGFPNTTPRLLREPTESEQAQARDMVANRHVETREADYREALASIVNLNTIFAAGAEEARNPTNPALRAWNDANYEAQKNGGAGFEAQSGVAEAKEAARIHWQNRRSARA